jgi:hypothetical protein
MYIAYRNLLLESGTQIAAKYDSNASGTYQPYTGFADFQPDNLLDYNFLPGFKFDPTVASSALPADGVALLIEFPSNPSGINYIAIDASTNIRGAELDIAACTSSTFLTADGNWTFTRIGSGADAYVPHNAISWKAEYTGGGSDQMQYLRIRCLTQGIVPGPSAGYIATINWLFVGERELLENINQSADSRQGLGAATVINNNLLGHQRVQQRSALRRDFPGALLGVSEDNKSSIIDPLRRYASHGNPFFFIPHHETDTRESEYTRLVQWIDAAEPQGEQATRMYVEDTQEAIYNIDFNLREMADSATAYGPDWL